MMRMKKMVFAVIYQGTVKAGREAEYQQAWREVATYFMKHRGSLGSALHRTESGLWLAYSRWPNKATRDASWPKDNAPSTELPDEIRQAVLCIKECLESQLPEIAMEVVDDLWAPG